MPKRRHQRINKHEHLFAFFEICIRDKSKQEENLKLVVWSKDKNVVFFKHRLLKKQLPASKADLNYLSFFKNLISSKMMFIHETKIVKNYNRKWLKCV